MSNGASEASTPATLPTACVASVWKTAPAAFASSAHSRMGKRTPVSLFAHMSVTSFGPGSASAAR